MGFNVLCGHLAMLNIHSLVGSLLGLCSFYLFPRNTRSGDLIQCIVIVTTVNESVPDVIPNVVLEPRHTREYPFDRW